MWSRCEWAARPRAFARLPIRAPGQQCWRVSRVSLLHVNGPSRRCLVDPLPCQKHSTNKRADGGDADREKIIAAVVIVDPFLIEEGGQLRIAERDAVLFLRCGRAT